MKSGTSSKNVELFDRQTLILKMLKATVLMEKKNKGNDIVGVQTSIIDIICQHKRSALSELQPKILHRRFDARVFCSASFYCGPVEYFMLTAVVVQAAKKPCCSQIK